MVIAFPLQQWIDEHFSVLRYITLPVFLSATAATKYS